MKKTLSLFLRLLVAAAGIAYIAWTLSWRDRVELPAGFLGPASAASSHVVMIRRADSLTLQNQTGMPGIVIRLDQLGHDAGEPRFKPSIFTTLRSADRPLLLAGLLLVGAMWPLQAMRWLVLMRCRGLVVSAFNAFRLTLVGLFFNFSMPGMTGGDVVKGYYAAKGSGARGTAIVSVAFDRIAGLVGLLIMGGCSAFFVLDLPVARHVAQFIWCFLAVALLALGLYFSRAVRRVFGIDRLLDRASQQNFLIRIDRAAVAYRDHKAAVLLSVLIGVAGHVCNTTAVALAGLALGMDVTLLLLLAVLPVILLAGSLPISYQGLGVMEYVAMGLLLDPPAATANQIIGMLLMFRLYLIVYALLGSLFLLRGDISVHRPSTIDHRLDRRQ